MICVDIRLTFRHKLNYLDSLKAVKEKMQVLFFLDSTKYTKEHHF
jgi:hypothetical protein